MPDTKKTGKRKAGPDGGSPRKWGRFSLTPRCFIWVALWIGALLFTQLLRSSASNLFFGFVNVFPAASLVYTLIARSGLRVFMASDSSVTEKLKPFTYEFRLINERRLPCPFADAYIMLPRRDSVACSERLIKISLPPAADYTVSGTVSFRFRGTYDIGVTSVYVYDFFRMFRLRSDFDSFNSVCVLPRRMVVDENSPASVSDATSRTRKSPLSIDKIEVSDLRDYRLGDALKSIHWNLSSKSEELVVRDYNTGSSNRTYVLCDMSPRFPFEAPDRPFTDPYADPSTLPPPDVSQLVSDEAYDDMNEYCADGAVELAVATVLRELRDNRTVILMWFDRRSDMGAFSFELHSVSDFDTVFRLFATAPLASPSDTVGQLASAIHDPEDARYVFILPAIDNATAADLCSAPCLADVSPSIDNEVIVYDCPERYAWPAERKAWLELCSARLAESGLRLVSGTLEGMIVLSGPDGDGDGGKEAGNG